MDELLFFNKSLTKEEIQMLTNYVDRYNREDPESKLKRKRWASHLKCPNLPQPNT